MMNFLKQDVLYAARQLRKSPAFTAVAVVTLALGIGANTAFFGVVNSTLFRALPYPEPSRLVHLAETPLKSSGAMPVAYPDFLDWQRQQTVFSALAIYRTSNSMNLTTAAGTDRMSTVLVDHDFLQVVGVQPMLGRDLTEADDRTDSPLVLLLPYDTWTRRFHADASVVGRSVSIDGKAATIVGVLPRTFVFYDHADLVLPLGPFVEQFYMQTRNNHSNAMVVGRLKPGVTLAAARGDMESIAAHLAQLYPKSNNGVGVIVMGLHQYLTGDSRQQQLLLMAAVGLVLLIICVNIATLSLARSFAREREMAVRIALGAGRMRLVHQLMVESLLLATMGGVLGLLLASALSATLRSLVPFAVLQLHAEAGSFISFRVEAFAVVITLLTGAGFGLVPARQLSHASPNDVLKDRSAVSLSVRSRSRMPGLMIVAQVACATLLLVSAGLILRSLWSLANRTLGYEPAHVLSLHLASPKARLGGSPSQVGNFYETAAERLAELPGVESAAVTSNLAFDFNDSHNQFHLPDRPTPAPADFPSASYRVVSRDYFEVMGIPLLQGHVFTGSEPMPSFASQNPSMAEIVSALQKIPFDVVVTRSFAQHYWPGQNPIGKSIILGPPDLEVAHGVVIGMVGDTTQDDLGQSNYEEFYISLRQFPAFPEFSLIMRTRGDPALFVETAKNQLRHMTTTEAVYDVEPLAARVSASIAARSFQTELLSGFAAVALILASVGLYGVLAFNVGQHSREIGIRMALGASPRKVIGNVLLRGFALVIPGLVVGLLGAWAVGRSLESQLYAVSATDPETYALGAAALLLVALLACWVPARRAAKINPVEALRAE